LKIRRMLECFLPLLYTPAPLKGMSGSRLRKVSREKTLCRLVLLTPILR
jgi:hypothetical protein